jgi:hypothetical protein
VNNNGLNRRIRKERECVEVRQILNIQEKSES